MRNLQSSVRLLTAALFLAVLGHAHVDLLAPVGQEKLKAGATFSIEWKADDHDCVYNLYFSANSGATWQTIVLNLPKTVLNHSWTVPNQSTTKAKVRVLQDNHTGTDPSDTSDGFTIEPASGLADIPAATGNVSMYFQSGSVEVSFDLLQAAAVTVQGFDARGKLAATLLDGHRAAGNHRLSFFSNRLQSAGPCIFKVSIGGQVHVFKPTVNN